MSTWQPPLFSATQYSGQPSRFGQLQMAEMQNFQHLFQQLRHFKDNPRVFHSQPDTDVFDRRQSFKQAVLALSTNN
jgi:hypothetical protein